MTRSIYLVDDHPVMLEAYTSLLGAEADLELCGTAGTAEDALDALVQGEAQGCDLVLADYRLPGRSGADLARCLCADRPGLPTVVISAYEEETFARLSREAGAVAFLRKRDLYRTLVPAIWDALGGHSDAS